MYKNIDPYQVRAEFEWFDEKVVNSQENARKWYYRR